MLLDGCLHNFSIFTPYIFKTKKATLDDVLKKKCR